MFKTLAALVQHSPVHVVVSAEGDKLRANINRKPDDDKDVKVISLSLLGTPEELDVELPLALAEHFLEADAPKSVAEQVKAQVAAGDDSATVEPKVEKLAGTPRKVKARAPKVSKPAKAPRKAKEAPAKVEKPEPATKPRKGRKPRSAGAPAAKVETKPALDETQGTNPETNPPLSETATASAAAREGDALPNGVTREVSPPDAAIAGDGTGQALPAIPASSRDASTLDLF